jgi:hypothetical protein
MLGLIIAAVIVLATLGDVDAPLKQLDLDLALPPLPDNVAAYQPIPRERMRFEQNRLDRNAFSQPERVQLVRMGNNSYKSDAGFEVTLGERP